MTFLAEFQKVPFFTKKDLIPKFSVSPDALNERMKRALQSKKLLQLKKGLYTTSIFYFNEADKMQLQECIAAQLCAPSYLSLEYVLQKHHLLLGNFPITSITTKSGRSFKNVLGSFEYKNLKKPLFAGFERVKFHEHEYFIATKAKALFDYLYLKANLPQRNLKKLKRFLFEESGIQWQFFSKEDFDVFDTFVWKSNSFKMMKIWHILNEYFAAKDFQKFRDELLK